MEPEPEKKSNMKTLLIVVGVVFVIAVGSVIGFFVWLFSGPESGVKMNNEMDEYALEYMEEHGLLNEGEEIVAYYDVTMSMDSTEAAILTTERVIYHKNGRTTSIDLDDVVDVQHRYESITGDVIEVRSKSGTQIKIEIAPLNMGESFYNALIFTLGSTSSGQSMTAEGAA